VLLGGPKVGAEFQITRFQCKNAIRCKTGAAVECADCNGRLEIAAIDVAKIPGRNHLYRDSSVGMAAAGLMLGSHGQDNADNLAELFAI
jgi:hypothetical protein